MSNLIRWNSWYYSAASALLLVAVLACGTTAPQDAYEPMDITSPPTPAPLSLTTTDTPSPISAPQSDPDNGGEDESDDGEEDEPEEESTPTPDPTPTPTPLPTRCVVVPSPYQEDGILREGEQITDGVKEYCSVLEPKPTPKYLALGQLTYKVQKTEEDIAEAEESEGAGGESGQSQVEIPIVHVLVSFATDEETDAAIDWINANTPEHDPQIGKHEGWALFYAHLPVTLLVPLSELAGFEWADDAEKHLIMDPQ